MALPGAEYPYGGQNGYQYSQVPQSECMPGAMPPGYPYAQGPPGFSEEESARRAAGTLFVVLGGVNPCKIETCSVYGPAIVMPQFARSTGYHRRVTELALRSLLFV